MLILDFLPQRLFEQTGDMTGPEASLLGSNSKVEEAVCSRQLDRISWGHAWRSHVDIALSAAGSSRWYTPIL